MLSAQAGFKSGRGGQNAADLLVSLGPTLRVDIGLDIFPTFADALHQTIRGLLAPDFSPQAEVAWSGLVRRIHRLTRETFTAGAV